MKKFKLWVILFAMTAAIFALTGMCACKGCGSSDKDGYSIVVDLTKPTQFEVGDTIDYTQYFTVTDKNGMNITVTEDMLNLKYADTSAVGSFTVTLKLGSAQGTVTFHIVEKGTLNTPSAELSKVLAKYTDITKWNFAISYQEVEEGTVVYEDYYEYLGKNILYTYSRYDDNDTLLGEATDYLGYDEAQQAYYLYYDSLNNTYTKYKEDTTEFTSNYAMFDIDISKLAGYTFTETNDGYEASSPDDVGNAVIGEFSGYTWTNFKVQISNGNISQIDATMSDGYILRFVFSKQGQVNFTLPKVTSVTVNSSKATVIHVDDEIDFTEYFIISDDEAGSVTVTNDMLDLSKVDVTKTGSFTVTAEYKGVTATVTITVVEKGTDITTTPAALAEILAKYTDSSKWNFAITYLESVDGYEDYEEYYEYLGNLVKRTYTDDYYNESIGYMEYDPAAGAYYCYLADSDGKYVKYDQDSDEFENFYGYSYIIDLSSIASYTFIQASDYFMASDPSTVGNEILGEYTSYSWTTFNIYVENGNISKIAAVLDAGSYGSFTQTYTFSKYGTVDFTIPDATDGNTPTEPTGTMESQIYDENFDDRRLQDRITVESKDYNPYIGLPSTGEYHALVIPVEFKDETEQNKISPDKLANLEIAFNGTPEQTGWESVKTYYQKASYGKLNLSFDIQPVYYLSKTSSYYDGSDIVDSDGYKNGSEVILKEVLAGLDPNFDFEPYDWNKDGAIDAVYLIYSASVVYGNSDSDEESIYWAYVTWDYNDTKYDEKDAFYYLFAGFDFMDENVKDKDDDEYVIDGLNVNASTYIHETGHLLGLDDYYDYDTSSGSNKGLGGADMMDYTVGDQNVYSKTMLGWMTPTIVVPSETNTTQTVTIKSSQAQGDAILIPLNFNNSYFCEYLLIDLYSAEGLNAMHASMNGTYLYDGEKCGVRIYHVSSSIDNPYNDNYGSFTDNNNSVSKIPLIKLVEADGGNTSSTNNNGAWASASDLWQAGQSLGSVFSQYMTNDAKLLNFDITIDSIDEITGSATITITYNA